MKNAIFRTGIRIEKILVALMRLYPKVKDFVNASIFDKNYFLNAIFNASLPIEHDAIAECKQIAPY